jgi:hypothetical protein
MEKKEKEKWDVGAGRIYLLRISALEPIEPGAGFFRSDPGFSFLSPGDQDYVP